MKTRAQQDMSRAERLVTQVKSQYPGKDNAPSEVQKIYGGLCHKFPILVRTCGLCQAIAFSMDKATPKEANTPKARNTAHGLLLAHIAEIFGCEQATLLAKVRDGNALDYMMLTRSVLSSWIYFKRFAVSILKVTDASQAEDNDQDK